MSDMLISIVIPCFNSERYIGDAIRSALEQTYRPIEVIVIDDGSTDGSLEVIRAFGKEVKWQTGANRGACAARNLGLQLAQGSFVQFLDADDLLHPHKLERQLPLVIAHPESIVYCRYNTKVEHGPSSYADQAPVYDGCDPVVFVLSRSGIGTPSPLHWIHNLKRVNGFREELPCAQERDLHLRLACSGLGFHHFAEELITVRRVTGSVSSNFIRILDQHSNIAWRAHTLLAAAGELSEERKLALAGFLARDARAYAERGFTAKADEYFAQARRLHPSGGLGWAYGAKARLLLRIMEPYALERVFALRRSLASVFKMS